MHKIINFDDFWEDSDYAKKNYIGQKVDDQLIAVVQNKLKYKLPESYIQLIKNQNGGIPKRTNHRTSERTSWSYDHIAISGIFGIDDSKIYSLMGDLGSQFMIDEWEYPDIGIYICNCPSGGHDMICLDYSQNGVSGEPQVVHIDQENNYKKTFISDSFANFILNLEDDSAFE